MSKKSAGDSLSNKMELINKKVREINERRHGMRVTRIEDELDRQELQAYARLMGVEQGDISLESAEKMHAPTNIIHYATLATEALIELVLLYIATSYLLAPAPATGEYTNYIMAAALLGIGAYLAYLMYGSIRKK